MTDDRDLKDAAGEDVTKAELSEAFGNAETIPDKPKYIANFDGDEIDGKVYKMGDEIDGKVDAGTLRYLVQIGRISEQSAGDSGEPALGGTGGTGIPAGSTRPDLRNMDRAALLNELADGEDEDRLREAVARRRKLADEEAAEERERAAAERQDGSKEAEEPADLDAAEIATRDKLVADNNKTELLKIADDEGVEGVTEDNNKTEIATKVVLARRAPPDA